MRKGQHFRHFLPNNDLDTVGGDSRRSGEIRTAAKRFHPHIFDPAIAFLYVWQFDHGTEFAERMDEIAERLCQLGRGVDMAWARAEILDLAECDAHLTAHPGVIYRPSPNREGRTLACPLEGSLVSLIDRHEKNRTRFKTIMEPAPTKKNPTQMKIGSQTFSQPPKARFAQVAYNSPPERRLYDLRDLTVKERFHPWPLREVTRLVELVRDRAATRLQQAYKEAGREDLAVCVDRVFIGRNATEADKPARIRIVPLPSIRFRHVDASIRRILLDIPTDCPLPHGDIAWAFTSLGVVENFDPETGEISQDVRVVEADDHGMLAHYAVNGGKAEGHRLWRSVTPAALPEIAARRRIDPSRRSDPSERKGADERLREEGRAAVAVLQALRHACVATRVESIHVQREPFEARGARADAFAPGTRFAKERLWHVEIRFATPCHGPLIIGDGRYLGLGLMAPVKDSWPDSAIFSLSRESNVGVVDADALIRSVRRALMALSRDDKGNVPRLFSGHEPDGAPTGSGAHEHIFIAADDADNDGRIERLIVAAPWLCDRSRRPPHTRDRALFDRVVSSLSEVRAGRLGVIALGLAREPEANDSILCPTRTWISRTPYCPTRHPSRGKDPIAAVARDVATECKRRGLPEPEVDVLEFSAGPNGGNPAARLRLCFAVAVHGPILLGRNSHMGGGLFAGAGHDDGG